MLIHTTLSSPKHSFLDSEYFLFFYIASLSLLALQIDEWNQNIKKSSKKKRDEKKEIRAMHRENVQKFKNPTAT